MAVGANRQVTRGDGVSFSAQHRVINAARIDILDDDGYIIGFVQGVNETLSRQVQRVRHLNSLDALRVIEMVPGAEDVSITLSGYSLYDKTLTDRGSLIHRLGSPMAAAKSLMGQAVGFNLIMLEKHPATGEYVRSKWVNCWITNSTRSRSVNNVVNVDSATVQVGIRA